MVADSSRPIAHVWHDSVGWSVGAVSSGECVSASLGASPGVTWGDGTHLTCSGPGATCPIRDRAYE